MTSDNLKIEDVEYANIHGGTIMYQSRTGRGTLVHAPEMEIVLGVQANGYYSLNVRPSQSEAVERDAARYRWLRDGFTGNAVDVHELTLDADEMTPEQFDAAVDTEMNLSSAPEGKE